MDDPLQKGIAAFQTGNREEARNSASPEKTYYQEGSNLVTNTRAVLNSQTYALADLTSVSLVEKPADRALGLALAITGVGWTALSIYHAALFQVGIYWELATVIMLGMFFFGLVSWAMGVFIAIIFSKAEYIIVIGSSSGGSSWEFNALTSPNKKQLGKVVEAINQAISSKARSSEEITYYQNGDVTVTNTRIILNSKTYAMANISSVAMGEIPANRTSSIIFVLIGLGGLISELFATFDSFRIITWVAFLGIGISVAILEKPKYTVKILSASGESKAITSADKALVQKIVDSISQAIIKRG